MTPDILDQCTTGAFDGSVPFPETIKRIAEDGVEWYSANLIFGMKTYYEADLSHYQTPWASWTTPQTADEFRSEGVGAAVRAIQAQEINYLEFLKRIAEAGVVYYTVHLKGRKAIYFGRHGEFYIEPFPGT
ncbi:MAG TPA: DUF1398 family protein [Terrimicrobiaceae bacterium]|nr:DUF1398 family protein [Terrimicrobiaceae bacterium]